MKIHSHVEMIAVGDLKESDRNARTHSAAQVDQIAEAIKEFGFTNPILIDKKNEILAGHGRRAAAIKLGIKELPCIRIVGLTIAQAKALRISDNQIALNAGWNEDLLRLELIEMKALDFDLAKLGFSTSQLNLLTTPSLALFEQAEETPAVEELCRARSGDVFILGDHRVICGDATVGADVVAVLAGAKPHLMVTDPPYGVAYDANWRNEADRANGKPYGASAIGKFLNDDRVDWRQAWALFAGNVLYCWHGGRHAGIVQSSLEATDFEVRAQIIWAKNNIAIGRGDYHWRHEPCWYAVRKGKRGHWSGDRTQSTLWQIDKPHKSETGHSTQKPIECMRRPILNNSVAGDAIYDPFLGSGTTLIACEMEGRRCYGIEISPAYIDVTIKRWQQFTGKLATRESDGVLFDDLIPAPVSSVNAEEAKTQERQLPTDEGNAPAG